MPVYTYQCPTCGKVQEEYSHTIGGDEVRCTECSVAMRKVPSPVGPPQGGGTPTFYGGRR